MTPSLLNIQGQIDLKGSIEVLGSKNAALPILASSLLFTRPVQILNVPQIEDVFRMVEILESMGVKTRWEAARKLSLDASKATPETLNQKLVQTLRASILIIGPLLARFKHCRIAHPGGCGIGVRPLDTHFQAFKDLGITITSSGPEDAKMYEFNAEKLHGGEVILEEFSVTATENVLMLVSLLPKATEIKIAAAEPHIRDLITVLAKSGVNIHAKGDHIINIKGRTQLKPISHTIIPDYLEAGTFLILSALFKGQVGVKNVPLAYLDAFRKKMQDVGVTLKTKNKQMYAIPGKTLQATKIQTLPYPGFPTDLQAPFGLLLTQAQGSSLIHEPLYEKRFGYLGELQKLGANTQILNPHEAKITGQTPLTGARITSFDLRAGITVILAALIAKGQTTIENVYQVDRGYEAIDTRLQMLGAHIQRT